VPAKGQHYGLLKYLAGLAQRCEDGLFQRHGITFNYLGQFAALAADADAIAVASESSGRSISPRRPRDSGIAFDGLAANGELRFTIRYDRMQLTAAEIAALAACYTAALEELVAYWSQHDLNSVTPADFPLLSVSAAELADWRQRWPSFSDAYPATPVQQGMIFHSLRDAASGAGSFVNQLFMDVDGEIDLPRLNQAWQQVIARHDVFRTAFVALEQGGVAQVVLPCAPRTWSVGFEDLAQLAAGEQQQVMARYAAEDRARGFDFAQPPLIRVALWKLADRHYCLLWTSHHAIIDGWSIPLVFRSLLQSYSAPGATVSPAPSFRDYVQWLARSERGAAKQFWREQLGQLDSACLLRRDAKGERHGVGTQLSVLERGLLEDLVRAAQSLGVTTYSLVQAAWAYVLHLYTGQRSVIFGSITSGRPAELSEADSTVGLFINTLPVVIDVDLTQSLAQWIRTIHQRHLQGQEFGHLPLVEILAQAPAGAGRLFNTALVYQNYPLEAAQRSDAQAPLRISNVRSEEATEADATVVAMPGSAGLTLKLMYSQRALSEVLSAQLLEHLARVLRVVPACVQLPLHELDAALVQPESDADLQHCSDAELQALLAEIADQTQS
jgi:non-ribosomal peptide synthase protein (TIGR01720 family)